jgi:hypothetical protein
MTRKHKLQRQFERMRLQLESMSDKDYARNGQRLQDRCNRLAERLDEMER